MDTKLKKHLLLLLIGILSMPMLMAQETRTYYDYNRDWTLGFHAGLSWQESDMYDRFGGGLGLTLGKRVYGAPGSFWAFDWRGRLTYTNNFGQDHRKNLNIADNPLLVGIGSEVDYSGLGYVYNNYRNDMFDLDLEGVLTLNALRERTGVIAQLFGGLGIGIYDAKLDQLDDNGNIYSYDIISDSLQTPREIRGDLYSLRNEFFRDGIYETTEGTQLTFIPTWGFGLGYQPRTWFSFGYEHRFGYPFTDKFDGVEANNPDKSWINDIHHLSYLYARFHFGVEGECLPPVIRVNSPASNPVSTQAPSINIDAEIEQISNRREIEVTVNDLPNYSYAYNTSTDNFSMTVLLQQGENVIRIKADNNCGEDVAVIRVIYNPNIVGGTPPAVAFTNPSVNQYTTNDANFNLRANVMRVDSKTDIAFVFNGQSTTNFSYRNNEVQSNLNLREGVNTVEITGRNRYGEDTKSITIIYKEREPDVLPPVVRITTPATNPYATTSPTQLIVAQIDNVARESDVRFTVNGFNKNFSYNTRTGRLESTITLVDGQNEVVIEGSNVAGTDQDRVVIQYSRGVINPPVTTPPTVNVYRPSRNPEQVTNSNYIIKARVRHVNNKSQIQFTMNGRNINDFSYNPGSDELSANVNLNEGANVFKIVARNSDGEASDGGNIVYKRDMPVVQPPVVDINSPNNGAVFSTQQQQVRATIRNVDNQNQITFKVNGVTSSGFSYNANTDQFMALINLVVGQNTIEILAANSAGTDRDDVKVVYKNPIAPPVITITQPARNPENTDQSTAVVAATILNINAQNQITFTVNGQNTAFTFDPTTKQFRSTVTLREGVNNFNIKAVNSAGQDQGGGAINYRKPITAQPPVVTVVTPSANPFATTQDRADIKATVTNVTQRSGIDFRVNGGSVTNFSYNPMTGQFSANVGLREGNNDFVITGTNNVGRDQGKGRIVYKKQPVMLPPNVVIQSPSNNAQVNSSQQVVRAKIDNVNDKSQITFVVNGRASNDFTFNAKTLQFAGNTNLQNGNNQVEIKARNGAGQDADNVNIVYRPNVGCDKPVITMVSPTVNPFTTSRNDFPITADVQGVAATSGIAVVVNGAATSSWYFDVNTKRLTIDYTNWRAGSNKVVIRATNNCGTTTKEITIIYKQITPPSINFTDPVGNGRSISSAKERITVQATVQNADKRQIVMTVNGRRTDFNLSGNRLSAGVSLAVGQNTVKLTAKNDGGEDNQTIIIDYTKPVLPPSISFSKPGGSVTVKSDKYDVRAIIRNMDTKSGIVISVNGQSVSSFSFNAASGTIGFRANLKEGMNTIQIVARNSAGADVQSVSIKYEKPAPTRNSDADGGNRGNNGNGDGSVIRTRSVEQPKVTKPKVTKPKQQPNKPEPKRPEPKKPVDKTKVKKPATEKPTKSEPKKPASKKDDSKKDDSSKNKSNRSKRDDN